MRAAFCRVISVIKISKTECSLPSRRVQKSEVNKTGSERENKEQDVGVTQGTIPSSPFSLTPPQFIYFFLLTTGALLHSLACSLALFDFSTWKRKEVSPV